MGFLLRLVLTLVWLAALMSWGISDWRFWLVFVLVFWWFPAPRPRKRCRRCGE